MRPLAQETNVEYLREYAALATNSIRALQEEVALLKKAQDQPTTPFLAQGFEDQLTRLQKKFFGFGRERLVDAPSRPLGHKGQELLIFSGRPHLEVDPAPKADNKDAPRADHDFTPESLVSESHSRGIAVGADAWKKINGLTEDTVEITVIERVYSRVVHRQAKYRLKDEYNTTGKEVIITAPGPVKVKPGMTYSVDFALSVVSDKYEYHVPLERQRRKMEAAGFSIDVKTLYTLCEAVAEHVTTILPGIKKEIQSDYCAVHLDESPWRILSTGEQGYLWVMSNRLGSYYQFEPTRSGLVPLEMMRGYDGAIVTDAYGGYNRLAKKPTIRIQHCWAHARREFYERFDDYPVESRRAIELIDQLFAIEHEFKRVEDIHALRRTKSRPLVDEFRAFLFEAKPRFMPGEGISKAIQYCLNHWSGLTHFLTDSTVPMTNNDAERALRHAVVGRKNFLGCQTINGADTMAALYTVIETAKKNSTQPTEYLKYLVTERWHGRTPLTPKGYADQKLRMNTKIKWPSRDQWKIV